MPQFRRIESIGPNKKGLKIVETLGTGATAVVYLCCRTNESGEEDEEAERVAVKTMQKSILQKHRTLGNSRGSLQGEDGLDKVRREIAVLKKLVHKSVVQLHEVLDDEKEDAVYLVMDFCPGGCVMSWDQEKKQYISPQTGGVLPSDLAARYFREACRGLRFIHANYICHRDLKPENLLVGKDGSLKLADFGVAHQFCKPEVGAAAAVRNARSPRAAAAAAGTAAGDGVGRSVNASWSEVADTEGTWLFWAPEMCGEEESFEAAGCDVWALGVCLWCFCLGAPPFYKEHGPDLFDAILEEEPRYPGGCDLKLQSLLAGLLDKTPATRLGLEAAAGHEWVAAAGGASLVGSADGGGVGGGTADVYRVTVTDKDMHEAITSVNDFKLIVGVAVKMKNRLRRARQSLSSQEDLLHNGSVGSVGSLVSMPGLATEVADATAVGAVPPPPPLADDAAGIAAAAAGASVDATAANGDSAEVMPAERADAALVGNPATDERSKGKSGCGNQCVVS